MVSESWYQRETHLLIIKFIRYKIIEGIGRGLLHLHDESGLRTIHQNLKASNILLDKNMTPKVSDYCLAKLFLQAKTQGGIRRTTASLYIFFFHYFSTLYHYSI